MKYKVHSTTGDLLDNIHKTLVICTTTMCITNICFRKALSIHYFHTNNQFRFPNTAMYILELVGTFVMIHLLDVALMIWSMRACMEN